MLQNILTGYIENALAQAEYDKLEDGTFSGRIPSCKGVIAFGKTLRECENELQSTFEDWIFVGLKLGHTIPMMLSEVESIVDRSISANEWNSLA